MATDTIRIPTTWKPLLTQLKQAVTAEQGEQILQAAIAPVMTLSPHDLAAPSGNSDAAELSTAIAGIHPPDELPESPPESAPAPEPTAPARVRLILRNDTLASVVIGTQRYRVDKVLVLPRSEADTLAAALQSQQQGYTPNPTRIEWQP